MPTEGPGEPCASRVPALPRVYSGPGAGMQGGCKESVEKPTERIIFLGNQVVREPEKASSCPELGTKERAVDLGAELFAMHGNGDTLSIPHVQTEEQCRLSSAGRSTSEECLLPYKEVPNTFACSY